MQAIQFHQHSIPVFESQGQQWVSVRHVCEALGVDSKSQREKLKTSPEFTWGDITSHDTTGRIQEMFCISAKHAHLWIAGISSSKVKPEIRDQFIAYKHECAEVIHNHFSAKGHDMFGIAQQLAEFRKEMNEKIDSLAGVSDTVFGDDKEEIQTLVKQVADAYGADGRTVWGWIQTDCDIGSYKKQTLKIKNFLRTKLGKGISLVKDGQQ